MDEFVCEICEEDVPLRRWELGYHTCLQCGAQEAYSGIKERANQIGIPYNKGGLQYITPGTDLKTLGRK